MTLLALAGDDLGAGFIAFLVVLALGIGTFFLLRSMNRHLRKVPSSFTPPDSESSPPAEGPTSGTGGTE